MMSRIAIPILLVLCTASAAVAQAPDQPAFRVTTKITLRKGDGATISSVERQQDIAFEDVPAASGAGRMVRLMIGDGASDSKGALRLLVLDPSGNLVEPFAPEPGIEIRPEQMGAAEIVPAATPPGAQPRLALQLRWPLSEGQSMPVAMDIEPGRHGGRGDEAWREFRCHFHGERRQGGSDILHLEGSGRLVLAQGSGRLLALDLRLCSGLRAAGRLRAEAEAVIRARPAQAERGDIPEWGCVPAPDRRDGRLASTASARRPLACLLGCGWLLGLMGGLAQGRRRREQILSVLLAISLGLGALPALATETQDLEVGAISSVGGVLLGVGTVFLGLKAGAVIGATAIPIIAVGVLALVVVGGIFYGVMRIRRGLAIKNAQRAMREGPVPGRIEAMHLLGEHGGADVVPELLLAAQYDPEPTVRAAAVQAIGTLKATDVADSLQRVGALDEDPLVKRAVDDVLATWQSQGILRRLQGAMEGSRR